MSSQDPFLNADSKRGSRGDSKMISMTSLSATHDWEVKKLQQMSIKILI